MADISRLYQPNPFSGIPFLGSALGGMNSTADLIRALTQKEQPKGLVSRSVRTEPVNEYGVPTRYAGEQFPVPGVRPAITQGVQPAGTVQMPAGARPASVGLPGSIAAPTPMPSQGTVWDPFGTRVANQDQSRLPSSDPRMAFSGEEQNPALGAIDSLMGSGNSTMPRPNPFGYRAPTPRPSGGSGDYVIQKGDTLSALAKRYGTTVQALAQANGISDPNKIRAGARLNIGMAAPPPQSRQAQAKKPTIAATLSKADNRARQIAEGKASQLDAFGMIK